MRLRKSFLLFKERFSDMTKIGERISWMTVHGPRSGVIEKETDLGWFVRLDGGMTVIVHEDSIIENNERLHKDTA